MNFFACFKEVIWGVHMGSTVSIDVDGADIYIITSGNAPMPLNSGRRLVIPGYGIRADNGGYIKILHLSSPDTSLHWVNVAYLALNVKGEGLSFLFCLLSVDGWFITKN